MVNEIPPDEFVLLADAMESTLSGLVKEAEEEDPPPTSDQIQIATWLAEYKNTSLPKKVSASNKHWWKWINKSLTKIDCDDAKCAKIDFNLTVDFDDPVSVIGALKYKHTVDDAPARSKKEEAIELILDGYHPYEVENVLDISPQQLEDAVKEIELGGYAINWGSV